MNYFMLKKLRLLLVVVFLAGTFASANALFSNYASKAAHKQTEKIKNDFRKQNLSNESPLKVNSGVGYLKAKAAKLEPVETPQQWVSPLSITVGQGQSYTFGPLAFTDGGQLADISVSGGLPNNATFLVPEQVDQNSRLRATFEADDRIAFAIADKLGYLYVALLNSNKIIKVSPSGTRSDFIRFYSGEFGSSATIINEKLYFTTTSGEIKGVAFNNNYGSAQRIFYRNGQNSLKIEQITKYKNKLYAIANNTSAGDKILELSPTTSNQFYNDNLVYAHHDQANFKPTGLAFGKNGVLFVYVQNSDASKRLVRYDNKLATAVNLPPSTAEIAPGNNMVIDVKGTGQTAYVGWNTFRRVYRFTISNDGSSFGDDNVGLDVGGDGVQHNVDGLTLSDNGEIIATSRTTNTIYSIKTAKQLNGVAPTAEGDYPITFNIEDPFNGALSTQVFTLKVRDLSSPVITQTNPVNNAQSLSNLNSFSITFDRDFQVDSGAFKFYQANTNTLLAEFKAEELTINDKTITFSLAKPLYGNTSYYVKANDSLIKNINGGLFDGLKNQTAWTFATAPFTTNITSTPITYAKVGANYTYNVTSYIADGSLNALEVLQAPAWLKHSAFGSAITKLLPNQFNSASRGATDANNNYYFTNVRYEDNGSVTDLYKTDANGSLTKLRVFQTSDFSTMDILDGYLYYTYSDSGDKLHFEKLALNNIAGNPEIIISEFEDISYVEDLAFYNGYAYFTYGRCSVLKVDISDNAPNPRSYEIVYANSGMDEQWNRYSHIAFDSKGRMYASTYDGDRFILRFDTETGLPERIVDNLYAGDYIKIGKDDNLYVGFVLSPEVRRIKLDANGRRVEADDISIFLKDKNGNIISDEGGVNGIAIANDGTIFYTAYNSIFKIDPSVHMLQGVPANEHFGDNNVVIRLKNNTNNNSVNQSFTINVVGNTPPTVTALNPANSATLVEANILPTITFNRPVKKGTGNILILNAEDGAILEEIDVTSTKVQISGSVVAITPNPIGLTMAERSIKIVVQAGAILDVVDNAFSGITANQDAWQFSLRSSKPSISNVQLASNNANSLYAKVGDILTLNFTSNDELLNSSVTILGKTLAATSIGYKQYQVNYTLTAADTEGLVSYQIVNFVNTFGISGDALSVQTSNITFDKTAPTIAGVANEAWYNTDVRITFTEGTAKLNRNAFTSGDYVSLDGKYTIALTDAAGNVNTVVFNIDKTTPLKPTNVVAANLQTTNTITWYEVAEVNPITYKIFVSKDGGVATQLATVTASTSYTHQYVTLGASYTYYIVAVDVAGNESLKSNETTIVVKAQQVFTVANVTKMYGDASFTLQASTLHNAPLVYQVVGNSNVLRISGNQAEIIGAGSATVKVSTVGNEISLAGEATFTVDVAKKPLTISLADATKVYGSQKPLSAAINGFAYADTFPIEVTSAGASETAAVGTYPISVVLKDANNKLANYTVQNVAASLTVTKKDLTVTAQNIAKTYGETTTYYPTVVSGLANGDNFLVNTSSGGAAKNANAGTHAILVTLTDNNNKLANYNVVYNEGILTVLKKELTVTSLNASKIYGQAFNSFTGSIIGLVAGDNITVERGSGGAGATAIVGQYQITTNFVDAGNRLPNYDVVNNVGYLTVSPQNLTVNAIAKTKTYGESDPSLEYTLSSGVLVGNDQFTGLLGRSTGERVGAYGINVGSLTAGNNYNLNFVGAAFNIAKANLAVVVNDVAVCQGASVPKATLSYSGFKLGDNATTLQRQPTITSLSGSALAAGSYPLVATNGLSDNYNFTYVDGVLRVNATPKVIISATKTVISKGEKIQLVADGAQSYSWLLADGIVSGQQSAALTVRPNKTTTYTVQAFGDGACAATASITVEVKEDYNTLAANNIVSPDGDGVNDFLTFENLDMYPKNNLKVFDRGGRILFQKTSYQNNWDCYYNGKPLPEGTYYYILDFGAGKPAIRGYITIIGKR